MTAQSIDHEWDAAGADLVTWTKRGIPGCEFVILEGGPLAGECAILPRSSGVEFVCIPCPGGYLKYERSEDFPTHFLFVGHCEWA